MPAYGSAGRRAAAVAIAKSLPFLGLVPTMAVQERVRTSRPARVWEERLAGGRPARRRPLQVREGSCVAKRAGDRGCPVGQRPNLKMVTPSRIGSSDAEFGCGHETEATVVARITKEADQRLARRVGSTDDGVHQSMTGSPTLVARQDADRPESERARVTDPSAGAHNLARDPIVADGHHCERWDPSRVKPERPDQERFRSVWIAPRSAECRGDHRIDRATICMSLSADDHRRLVARRAESVPSHRREAL